MVIIPSQGQSLQQLADSMQITPPAAGQTRLTLPSIPGAKVTLLGCDYESLIRPDGTIARAGADTPVRVCFTAKRDGEEVTSRDYEILIPASKEAKGGNAKPQVIPELLQWRGGKGSYTLGNTIAWKGKGAKSIAAELAVDLFDLFDKTMCPASGGNASITLHIQTGADLPAEGYRLSIRKDGVHLYASDPQGLYWGTRTLLQILRQGNGTAPCGTALDAPRYGIRGFMLDVARLPMPLSDLRDIIRTMSWYKMNELQLHLNDNYIFHEHYVDAGRDPFRESYAGFRLESVVKGADGTPLTSQDLHYTKAEFEELVTWAARHNVRIVPEFDTPGHALSFTRIRPDLIYQGPMNHHKRRCEMLDAANPEALKFAASVWDEYLLSQKGTREGATFANCPVVHVGADEFFGDKEDYRAYADGILRHVKSRGYTPRIWGSLHAKKGKTPVVSEGVQMNLWSGGWAKAWDSIHQGYDIINTDDGALYIVPFANYYRMDRNHKWVYNNWQVNKIHGQTVPAGHPQLLGAMFAIWQDESDMRHNGYMAYDYWESITGSLDVLGERMWGQPKPPRSFEEHRELVKAIGPAPRADIQHRRDAELMVVDIAPTSLPHELMVGSLGPAYHLTLELTLAQAPEGEEQVLLSSPAGQLLAVNKGGCIGLRRADAREFSFEGAKLPVGERVSLELIGKPGCTQLLINGEPAGTLTLKNGHNRSQDLLSTFILPLDLVGERFHGTIHRMKLSPAN